MEEKNIVESDKQQLDNVTDTFFSLFTNKLERLLDLSKIRDICITEAIIIKKTGLTQTVYNLDSFIEPRARILTDGTLREFEEKETEEQTHIIGHIAQRKSKYSKSGFLSDIYFNQQGSKMFHFIKTEQGWKISACIWEDEETPV